MNRDQEIVKKSVELSLIEIFIGGALHTFHIPFSGQILSLNQGFFLTRFLRDTNNRFDSGKLVMEVSTVTAILKAMSPIGKKLGPMLSISVQGFLYMLGIIILGKGIFGQILGMFLLSLWAFVQPLISYFLIYGTDLTKALHYYFEQQPLLKSLFIWIVLIKISCAIVIPILLRCISVEKIQAISIKLQDTRFTRIEENPKGSALKLTIKELIRPTFLLSLGLMAMFFWINGESTVDIFIKCLRALAIAFIIFYLLRLPIILSSIKSLADKYEFVLRLYNLSSQAYLEIKKKL